MFFHHNKHRILLTAMITLLCVVGTASAAKITATSNVVVRAKATTSSSKLTTMPKSTTRTVQGKSGKWYKIIMNGKTGYVHSNRVKLNDSAFRDEVVSLAKKQVGKKYVWGATGPNSFDCSGLTQYLYKSCGKSIPRVSGDQYSSSSKIKKSSLQKGDLVFFSGSSGGSVGHVGIYIGNNKMVHAANSNTGVVTTSMSDSYYVKHYIGAGRY